MTKGENPAKAAKNIYCFSGLGADKRVFQKLQIKGYEPIHINWLEPYKGEELADYAQRLTAQIKSKKPILIGLSFGGMVAIEVAKQIEVEKVIVISSAKSFQEIPFYFRMFRWFPLHCIFPFKSLLCIVYSLLYWLFGLENSQERQLLKAILVETDAKFLKWAIDKVVTWNNQTIPNLTYHLHGSSDRIFPITFIKPNITIKRGGHLMIINRANKISQLLDCIMEKNNRHQYQTDVE